MIAARSSVEILDTLIEVRCSFDARKLLIHKVPKVLLSLYDPSRSTVLRHRIVHNDHVVIEVYVAAEQVQAFMDWMVDLTNGNCNFTEGENVYLEEKIN